MALKEKYATIQFKNLGDGRGNLVAVEGGHDIPFDIQRVFYIFGTDNSVVRGQHANKESEFVLVCLAGQCKVRITDGNDTDIVYLNSPSQGLYINKMIWKDMFDFSEDSVLLVLASTHYNADEYIRDFDEYKNIMRGL